MKNIPKNNNSNINTLKQKRETSIKTTNPKYNQKIIKALEEANKIATDPNRKKYYDVDELLEHLLNN